MLRSSLRLKNSTDAAGQENPLSLFQAVLSCSKDSFRAHRHPRLRKPEHVNHKHYQSRAEGILPPSALRISPFAETHIADRRGDSPRIPHTPPSERNIVHIAGLGREGRAKVFIHIGLLAHRSAALLSCPPTAAAGRRGTARRGFFHPSVLHTAAIPLAIQDLP